MRSADEEDRRNRAGEPLVVACIPAYNEEKVVDRLMAHCTSFVGSDYEVVVVDDSMDSTAAVVAIRTALVRPMAEVPSAFSNTGRGRRDWSHTRTSRRPSCHSITAS